MSYSKEKKFTEIDEEKRKPNRCNVRPGANDYVACPSSTDTKTCDTALWSDPWLHTYYHNHDNS